ncbi:conserved hypothetical protein [Methylocella tundrae]|uniref:GTA TIM-barrel-like domain-containing protein n=1 Tax=Methylocella tundrae TaxID=227605 RepID=A0A8B6M390_METTU|nr:glycoside hydrolase TIM-barrel-like domain-containing protein [Methylocella tundrae]VTZ23244.1 conserved hypothetical protein [Methylocella tundrae]VTZ49254.1 conserved hypothetical protein [Methylocella tundrae]
MGYIKGVNLLPATGEWTYDTTPYLGRRVTELALTPINTYFAPGGQRTDLDYSIDQLQAEFPDCETVALVVAWFGDSVDASSCRIYPSTTYIGGVFEKWDGAGWAPDVWRCSGLTQTSPELIPISSNGASFNYGGTPSDQSIVRCIRDLKARGLRVVFYPFLLMDAPGFPWRGRIAYQSDDVSSGASAAAASFLGAATAAQFARDTANLTVAYSGSPTDYSFRRMILHYANLCVVGGGVDLFLLGSELRGLETIRGPAWTKAGTRDASGAAVWDYPFVSGLMTLCDDVRSVFDQAGLTKDETGLHNLISYAADWSAWMGYQHPAADGQWPHLDQLWAHENIDLVCFDNYLPLSDWTTGGGGIDARNWASPRPSSWPPPDVSSVGLGLTGPPTLTSKAYLKANIEGGEKFNWFYGDSTNLGRGLDPNGTDLRVSLPRGDRLAQDRQPYYANQELLANKKLRWWWNNSHRAIYDDGDGNGFAEHGPSTAWTAQSKPITFTEYGFPTCDRATNQPNVFFDAKSSESATPFWSVWQPAEVGRYAPAEDANLTLLALQAIYEYWVDDGQNETSAAGVKMIEPTFMSAWNWDARPFPAFPARSDVWGDAANWPSGNWLSGKGPFIPPPVLDLAPTPASPPSFPTLNGQSWSVHYKPSFATVATERASGRASRMARMATAVWEIELSFDALRMDDVHHELEVLAGFYESARGQTTPFAFPVSPALGLGPTVLCRFADDQADLEAFMNQIWQAKTVVLRTVKI